MDDITPAEMADACETSIDTLRFYEREGLLEQVPRTPGGRRRYRPEDVAWVQVLRCLRITEMPIRQLQRFAALVRAGDDNLAERLDLLQRHRQQVLRRIDELDRALEVLDHKIEIYSSARASDGHPAATPPPRTPRRTVPAGRAAAARADPAAATRSDDRSA